ncbi:MAG TPA: helix-turn-helix domain-containing GNAT family N-acetyltransferase [Blastocatellia bacterium]|jgi:DNA-binding MarR family transcriptional regulator/N-acetylglutamate synthase-like GNAT family acetyltransferase
MPTSRNSTSEEEQVSAMREFNRFYTRRLGLLRRRHLDGEFSLTEARILYEIGANPKLTASSLRSALGLDAGYISRLLALLSRRKLVRQTASKEDGREKLLTLSHTGARKLAQLNEQSALQIQDLLEPISASDRETLIESLSKVRSILKEARKPAVRIVRLSEANDDASRLLEEYYEAVSVVQRDTPEVIRQVIGDDSSGIWVAYLREKAVGCVMLRRLPSIPFAGECKRLYVRPEARGNGLADALLDAQEAFARSKGLRWIYLDSYDDLKAAIALYRKRGYLPCERYNDNPQATVFLRKNIGGRKS